MFVAVLAPAALATVTAISRGRESETKSNQIGSLLGDELGDEVAEGGAGARVGTERKWGKDYHKKRGRGRGAEPARLEGRTRERGKTGERARGADDRLMSTSMSIRATCAKPLARP